MANLVRLLIVGSFAVGCTLAKIGSNDKECLKDAKSFAKCILANNSSYLDEGKSNIVDTLGDRIKKCFKDNKCNEPDLDAEIFSKTKITGPLKDLVTNYKQIWEDTPEVVKTCMYKSLRTVAFNRMNKCLKEKKVDPIDVDENEFFEAIYAIQGPAENRSDENNAILKSIFNVMLEWKNCKKDKGEKAFNATLHCTQSILTDSQKEFCNDSKSCRNGKVSESCQKRELQAAKALCSCLTDKLVGVKNLIDKLPNDKEFFYGEFKEKVLSSDFEKDRKESYEQIQKCFKDNKIDEPEEPSYDAISWGMALSGHDARGALELLPIIFFQVALENNENPFYLKIKPEQAAFIHNILDQIIDAQDCGCDSKN